MTDRFRVRASLASLLLVVLGLTGCVQVPTAGPIDEVPGDTDACQSCVNVEVAPPAAGDDQKQIVEGYLRATSNYQPNYSVARQFLTASAAEAWRPEAGASIYTGQVQAFGTTARLTGDLVGRLAADRSYRVAAEKLTVDFGLVQEDGQWRISTPPPGLMVVEYAFQQFYRGYSVFFVGNETSLVPDRIYLPTLRNPANVASALMTALLDGPSDWLKPAVGSAVPAGTSLSAESVILSNGIAEVRLSENVIELSDPQRSQLAAQIVYTLRPVSGLKGVLISAGQNKVRVPEGDPTSLVVAIDAFSRELDPVPYVPDLTFALSGGVVQQVTDPNQTAVLRPIDGPLGQSTDKVDPDSLAVSLNGTDVAVASEGRTALHWSTVEGEGSAVQLLSGLQKVLRPQFSRYGEIWAVGQQSGRQRMWRIVGKKKTVVEASALVGSEVTAFRISPDGVRVALVRRTSGKTELGLARIVRGDTVSVEAWRPISLVGTDVPRLTRITDVAWLDSDELLVLGSEGRDGPLVPVQVSTDGSTITPQTGLADWDAEELTVFTRPETVIAVGGRRQSWRNTGSQWTEYLKDVTAVAYPG